MKRKDIEMTEELKGFLSFDLGHMSDKYHREYEDIEYASNGLTLDVYYPKKKQDKYPVFLIVYGGGWVSGFKRSRFVDMMLKPLEYGYACVVAEYTLALDAPFPQSIIDIKNAIGWIKTNGNDYHFNTNDISVWGESAGSHLALEAVLMPNDNLVLDYDTDSTVTNLLVFYPPVDITTMDQQLEKSFDLYSSHYRNDSVFGIYLKDVEDENITKLSNPINHISDKLPKIWIQHGTHDQIVPYQQSLQLFDALAEHSIYVYMEINEGREHTDEFYFSDDNISRMIKFVKKSRGQLLSEKIYSGWLGKSIGIRLGSPVENWSSELIKDNYGMINDYLIDYGVFGSDVNSNGPLFFVRSLLENPSVDIDVKTMSDNLLNYVSDGHGFFSWATRNYSTEEAAYENLKDGITAPDSGSYKINGKELANEIGGQSFSDCWGYVSAGNPDIAKTLAKKMSSVTHDLEAVQGGIFVAVCTSLAMKERDMIQVVMKAVKYLDEDSEYYKCVNDIIDFYHTRKSRRRCLRYILEKYPYSKYSGISPVIPNAAVMVMAMLYSKNDFSRCMSTLVNAGFNTTSNLSNVASIMGVLVGVDNIDYKWIKPINDVLLNSSSVGSMNINTISNTAKLFTDIACKLNNIDYKYNDSYDFTFKYGTQGLTTSIDHYSEISLLSEDNRLKVIVNQGFIDKVGRIVKKTYYRGSDIYDARYQPSFSPILYPNQMILVDLKNPHRLNIDIAIYVVNQNGDYFVGEYYKLDNMTIAHDIKTHKSDTIVEFGILIKYNERIMHDYFIIDKISLTKDYDAEIDFTKLWMEDFGLDFGGVEYSEVALCSSEKNNSVLTQSGVVVSDDFLIFMDVRSKLSEALVTFNINHGSFMFCFDVEGLMKYKGIKTSNNKATLFVKNYDEEYELELDFKFSLNSEFNTLQVSRKNDLLSIMINQSKHEFRNDKARGVKGSLGIKADKDSSVLVEKCECKALSI